MPDFANAISSVRDSICAVMRISLVPQQSVGGPPQFNVAFVGTAWCVVENRYFVTARHVFNNGQPRNTNDSFSLFFVPNNGPQAFHTQVTGFTFEDQQNDLAIIEISSVPIQVGRVPATPVTLQNQRDGSRVLTYGFPSPVISAAAVDVNGNWRGGQLLLKSHANEGIIAGQYDVGGLIYELNVGWHHGESGGPILRPDPVAAFALMQTYRGIQSPHGTYPGPHHGRSLEAIRTTLQAIGAVVV